MTVSTKAVKAAPLLLAAALLIASHTFAYRAGFQTASDKKQAVIGKMQQDAKAAEAQAEKAYAQSLERIARLTAELNHVRSSIEQRAVKMQQEAQSRKQQNKQGIENAIAQDKKSAACIDGMGAHSLRQYRHALGYGAD